MLEVELSNTSQLRQKVSYVSVTSPSPPLPPKKTTKETSLFLGPSLLSFKMAAEYSAELNQELNLGVVIDAINDLVEMIDKIKEPNEINSITLRLDYINRMLVTLDVRDAIRLFQCVVCANFGVTSEYPST